MTSKSFPKYLTKSWFFISQSEIFHAYDYAYDVLESRPIAYLIIGNLIQFAVRNDVLTSLWTYYNALLRTVCLDIRERYLFSHK